MAQYLGVDVVNSGEYFFVSYNTEDADRVSQYVKALAQKGLPLWYDYGIEVGDKWANTIADKIANSEAVIMFLSRRIFNKEESFVHKEWEMAKDFFDKKIYVIMLDDIDKKEVPIRYISWWIDVTHMQCIIAPNYSIEDCVDRFISSIGYSVKSIEKLIDETPHCIMCEETDIENKENNPDSKECIIGEEKVVDTHVITGDINEARLDDFIIKAGVLKKYKGKDTVVRIPDGVIKIGFNAFNGCESIKSITMPDCVTCIDSFAFNNCKSLESIKISDSVTSVDKYAFCGCISLTEIIIPSGVSMICDNTFSRCSSLTSITIPNGLTSIGDNAFWNCESLESITIPDSVRIIGKSVFYGCRSIKSIIIPDGVTNINSDLLHNCKTLVNVTIPDGVTSIGKNAFYNCCSLTNISIPNSVTNIGKGAFDLCDSLKSVVFGGTKEEWEKLNYKKNWYEGKPKYTVHFKET